MTVSGLWLLLTVPWFAPWFGLQCVFVVFPDILTCFSLFIELYRCNVRVWQSCSGTTSFTRLSYPKTLRLSGLPSAALTTICHKSGITVLLAFNLLLFHHTNTSMHFILTKLILTLFYHTFPGRAQQQIILGRRCCRIYRKKVYLPASCSIMAAVVRAGTFFNCVVAVCVLCLLLTVKWVGLRFVIVTFPGCSNLTMYKMCIFCI